MTTPDQPPSIPVVPGQPPFTLANLMPSPVPPKPRNRVKPAALVAVLAVVLVGGTVGLWRLASAPPASAPTPTAATPAHYANPDFTTACDIARDADDRADYSSATLSKALSPATTSGVYDVYAAVKMAIDRAELAEAADGTDREFGALLDAQFATKAVVSLCDQRGY